MELKRLLYVSFAPDGFDMERNLAILETARRENLTSGITGVLLCRDAVYLQVLEGPKTQLDTTFAAIRRDRRHFGVTVLAEYAANSRIFPGWQMGFYHMTAIEGMLGDVLIGNGDDNLQRTLDRHRGEDSIARTLDGFLRYNASEMRRPVLQPA
jgi:Sensors of blue-light using FAD